MYFAAEFKCPDGYFKCNESKTCIPLMQVCDGFSHCSDDSDETTDCSGMSSNDLPLLLFYLFVILLLLLLLLLLLEKDKFILP